MIEPYYKDDYATIYHGDCREILPHLEPVDLVLTDPPYGVTENKWDSFDWIDEWWELVMSATKAVVMTSQQPFTSKVVLSNCQWFKWADVWHKTQARGHLNANVMPLREHEDILVFCDGRMPFTPQFSSKPPADIRPNTPRTKGTSNYGAHGLVSERTAPIDTSFPRSVIRIANSQLGQHPTQKPIELLAYLLKSYAAPGQTILDPFMGSGTTLRAAKDLGIKSIGIEIEEKYCEIAAERLRQEVLAFD